MLLNDTLEKNDTGVLAPATAEHPS